jgi:hypothetical protein
MLGIAGQAVAYTAARHGQPAPPYSTETRVASGFAGFHSIRTAEESCLPAAAFL